MTHPPGFANWVDPSVCRDALHISTALSDPYSNQNIRHMTVQLSNRELDHDDYSTHLLHFRPSKPELSYFYPVSKTRTQVTAMQNKKKNNQKKKPKKTTQANTQKQVVVANKTETKKQTQPKQKPKPKRKETL